MKLVHFNHRDDPVGGCRFGVLNGELAHASVVAIDDLVASAALAAPRAAQFAARRIAPAAGGLARWLQLDAAARSTLGAAIAERVASTPGVPLASLQLRAPLARPGKIIGVGRNYADHAKETGVAPFESPRIIFKMASSVADPDSVVVRPPSVVKFDFEAELGVVIGAFARDVSRADALDCVAGYTVLNDLSAREFQFDVALAQTTFAKSMDGFCPLGPYFVSADAIPDPQNLRVRSWVNEVLMQDATTADMLFPVAELIAYLSRFMTLEPGDVIATGTPAGIGAFRTPPQWLQPGDRVRAEVSGIGALVTTIG